jgi:hypothetical protein
LRASSLGVCLLAAAVATNMGGTRLAEGSTVSALRDGTTLRKVGEHDTTGEMERHTFLLMCCSGRSEC